MVEVRRSGFQLCMKKSSKQVKVCQQCHKVGSSKFFRLGLFHDLFAYELFIFCCLNSGTRLQKIQQNHSTNLDLRVKISHFLMNFSSTSVLCQYGNLAMICKQHIQQQICKSYSETWQKEKTKQFLVKSCLKPPRNMYIGPNWHSLKGSVDARG